MVPTDSHRKRLIEQVQFRAPRSTRRRMVRSVEQLRDEVADEVVHPDDVVANKEVDEEVIVNEVVAKVVQLNVVVVDSVPSITADTEVTTPSIEAFVHTDGGFSREPIDWSVLTEYDDHVAYQLWQGEIYVFYV